MIVEHLSRFLGPVAGHQRFRWQDIDGRGQIDVLRFDGQPHAGALTLVSVGLADHQLQASGGRPSPRRELLVSAWAHWPDLPRFVASATRLVLDAQAPIPYGSVLGPAGPLVAGATVEAALCWQPVYFPDELARIDGDPAVELVWLVPLTTAEAAFVSVQGAGRFEELLLDQMPDALDLTRPELRLG